MAKIANDNLFFNIDPQISKNKSIKTEKNKKKTISKNVSTFEKMLNTEETAFENQQTAEEEKVLETLLKEIGFLGEKLKRSRTLEDLNQYKASVKKYMLHLISLTEKVETRALWDKNKKEKISKVHLEIVNKELLELTRIFFAEQQNTLAFAEKIDKIEGILINFLS